MTHNPSYWPSYVCAEAGRDLNVSLKNIVILNMYKTSTVPRFSGVM